MKKLFFIVLLMPLVALSQVSNKFENIVRKDTNGVVKAVLANRTYTSSTLDTSAIYQAVDWKNIWVTVASTDSARCTVKYQLSVDGTNWGVATTKDSLSTAVATGDVKSIDITSVILGVPYFRLIFDFTTAGVAQGTTSAKYWAILTRQQD